MKTCVRHDVCRPTSTRQGPSCAITTSYPCSTSGATLTLPLYKESWRLGPGSSGQRPIRGACSISRPLPMPEPRGLLDTLRYRTTSPGAMDLDYARSVWLRPWSYLKCDPDAPGQQPRMLRLACMGINLPSGCCPHPGCCTCPGCCVPVRAVAPAQAVVYLPAVVPAQAVAPAQGESQ